LKKTQDTKEKANDLMKVLLVKKESVNKDAEIKAIELQRSLNERENSLESIKKEINLLNKLSSKAS
jgi:hypothetical protein